MNKQKMYLNKLGIPALLGMRTKDVEVPGQPGVFVVVRELSAMDMTELGTPLAAAGNMQTNADGEKTISPDAMVKLYPAIIARCVVDYDGNPVFTEGEASRISYQYMEWITELVMTAMQLGGIIPDDDEEQPAKNE